MQLTSPIVSNSDTNNTNRANNINPLNNNNMVVSESNKSPSHIINLLNNHHSPSTHSTSPTSLTVPRESFIGSTSGSIIGPSGGRKVLGVILIDERMLIRHLCSGSSSDLIDLEYKNYLLLGSIVIEKETMSIDELRRSIADQITNLPKNYAFFSKEGWPLTKSQEVKLKACNLINKRSIICVRKIYDKPRIGVLTDSNEYLGTLFINYDCTLSDLRRSLDDIIRDSESIGSNSRLTKFEEYSKSLKHFLLLFSNTCTCICALNYCNYGNN